MDVVINKNLSERALEDYAHVKLALDGNQKSFKFLMDRYRNAIYHTMYKMVSNKEDADDLTQEAFTKAFNKIHSYQPRYAFSTWLFKIASNNCIDHIRKKTVYKNKLIAYAEQGPSEIVLNKAMSTLTMETIIQLVNQLKPTYRLCFILKEMDGYTFSEIAKELSINVNTAKWYLSEAKKILQTKLVQAGFQSSEKKTNGFKR